jgi:hypothetical protein
MASALIFCMADISLFFSPNGIIFVIFIFPTIYNFNPLAVHDVGLDKLDILVAEFALVQAGGGGRGATQFLGRNKIRSLFTLSVSVLSALFTSRQTAKLTPFWYGVLDEVKGCHRESMYTLVNYPSQLCFVLSYYN